MTSPMYCELSKYSVNPYEVFLELAFEVFNFLSLQVLSLNSLHLHCSIPTQCLSKKNARYHSMECLCDDEYAMKPIVNKRLII